VRSFSVEAIVLRQRALGEADRIVTVFSRERGKQSAVARGARRIASKFGGRLEFFNRLSLMLHAGRSLAVITSAQTVASAWEKLVDPDAYAAASYVAEAVDALCEPDLAVPEVYDALCDFQAALSRHVDRDELLAAMDLRLLDALGFGLELDACARCGAVLGRRPLKGGRAQLSPQAGGLVCDECARALDAELREGREPAVLRVNARDFARLRELRTIAFDQLGTGAAQGHGQLRRVTQAFVEHQMGRRSRAMATLGGRQRRARTAARRR
jgi:DNA repair protein RecO (recombination protein O)